MKKTNQAGFTAVEALIGVAVIAVIIVLGVLVTQRGKDNGARNAASQSDGTSAKNGSKPGATDPYKGWKTATLGDVVSFRYPSDWDAESDDTSPNESILNLNTKKNGWAVQMLVTVTDTDDGVKLISPQMISVLGGRAYLDFQSASGSNDSATGLTLSAAPDAKSKPHLILLSNHVGKYVGGSVVFGDPNGNGVQKVKDITADPEYGQVKLLFESVKEL